MERWLESGNFSAIEKEKTDESVWLWALLKEKDFRWDQSLIFGVPRLLVIIYFWKKIFPLWGRKLMGRYVK